MSITTTLLLYTTCRGVKGEMPSWWWKHHVKKNYNYFEFWIQIQLKIELYNQTESTEGTIVMLGGGDMIWMSLCSLSKQGLCSGNNSGLVLEERTAPLGVVVGGEENSSFDLVSALLLRAQGLITSGDDSWPVVGCGDISSHSMSFNEGREIAGRILEVHGVGGGAYGVLGSGK